MNFKKIIGLTFMSVFLAFILTLIFLMFFATIGGFFVLFNVEYDSLGSLGIFVGLLFIIGFFTEILFGGLITYAMTYARTTLEGVTIEFALNFVENLIVIMIVNMFVQSVHLSQSVVLLLAVVLAIGGCVLDSKYKLVKENDDM